MRLTLRIPCGERSLLQLNKCLKIGGGMSLLASDNRCPPLVGVPTMEKHADAVAAIVRRDDDALEEAVAASHSDGL